MGSSNMGLKALRAALHPGSWLPLRRASPLPLARVYPADRALGDGGARHGVVLGTVERCVAGRGVIAFSRVRLTDEPAVILERETAYATVAADGALEWRW